MCLYLHTCNRQHTHSLACTLHSTHANAPPQPYNNHNTILILYIGKKFNGRMERLEDTDYCGIKIFRFYIKCPACMSEIVIKTDPQHTDYIVEAGAQRVFEPWKQQQELERIEKEEERAEEEGRCIVMCCVVLWCVMLWCVFFVRLFLSLRLFLFFLSRSFSRASLRAWFCSVGCAH